jgi:hypothetical protein
MVNGIDELAVTNVDGLDTLDVIQVAVATGTARRSTITFQMMLNCCSAANLYMRISPDGSNRPPRPANGRICPLNAVLT